jgi:DNA-binding NarL/FixJ family response regulator
MNISSADRVLILEDHEEVAISLEGAVKTAFNSSTIVRAVTLADARKAVSEQHFDLALIDLGLPDGSGMELIKELAVSGNTFMVVTTIFDDNEHLFDCLSMGAQGYLLKGHQEEEIVEFLQGILSGRPPLSPSIAQAILEHFHKDSPPEDMEVSTLTGREVEVLQLIARGCQVREVAELLHIANSTVSAHIKKIYQKLDIHNRAEATAAAVNLNLYNP